MSERPNVRTERGDHRRYCGQAQQFAWPDDIRRCEHGRLQIAREVLGWASAQWFDLSPIFNPINYRRAARALRGVTTTSECHTCLVLAGEVEGNSAGPHTCPTPIADGAS